MSNETYHEPIELLSEETKNMHRAIVSLMEELQAVDWYQQRVDACPDEELRAVLTHNKNEEVEHAMMVLEWIRRKDSVFDANMAKYLNSRGPITAVEEKSDELGDATGTGDRDATQETAIRATGSLAIGSLKGDL